MSPYRDIDVVARAELIGSSGNRISEAQLPENLATKPLGIFLLDTKGGLQNACLVPTIGVIWIEAVVPQLGYIQLRTLPRR
jgi:hypothetical protein